MTYTYRNEDSCCEDFSKAKWTTIRLEPTGWHMTITESSGYESSGPQMYAFGPPINFCPYCGADIRQATERDKKATLEALVPLIEATRAYRDATRNARWKLGVELLDVARTFETRPERKED